MPVLIQLNSRAHFISRRRERVIFQLTVENKNTHWAVVEVGHTDHHHTEWISVCWRGFSSPSKSPATTLTTTECVNRTAVAGAWCSTGAATPHQGANLKPHNPFLSFLNGDLLVKWPKRDPCRIMPVDRVYDFILICLIYISAHKCLFLENVYISCYLSDNI